MLIYLASFVLNYLGFKLFLHLGLTPEKIRDDGPKSHLSKKGVMTMGGVVFVLISTVLILITNQSVSTQLFCLAWFCYGALGFYDDSVKLWVSQGRGLGMRSKLIIQFIMALVIVELMWQSQLLPALVVPFTQLTFTLPHALYVAFGSFVMVGSVNAVNFTDGLDGLAISQFIIVCAGLLLLNTYHHAAGVSFMGQASLVLIGSVVFWWFNRHPARIFMGDVGSVALGAALAYWFLVTGFALFYPIMGLVFVFEVLSVMIQIGSFKLTGQRVFRMAPFHHHLELSGWSNTHIVSVFMILSILLCLISFMWGF